MKYVDLHLLYILLLFTTDNTYYHVVSRENHLCCHAYARGSCPTMPPIDTVDAVYLQLVLAER